MQNDKITAVSATSPEAFQVYALLSPEPFASLTNIKMCVH